ncbi:hypothetical protein EON81_22950, partial [bacterium]
MTTSTPLNVASGISDLLGLYAELPQPDFYEEARHDPMLLLLCGRVFPVFGRVSPSLGRVALVDLPLVSTPEIAEAFPLDHEVGIMNP